MAVFRRCRMRSSCYGHRRSNHQADPECQQPGPLEMR